MADEIDEEIEELEDLDDELEEDDEDEDDDEFEDDDDEFEDDEEDDDDDEFEDDEFEDEDPLAAASPKTADGEAAVDADAPDQSLEELEEEEEESEDDEDEPIITSDDGPDRGEALVERATPLQAHEFICSSCFLVKHRSQIAPGETSVCLDCA